jgi:hypothetical protein
LRIETSGNGVFQHAHTGEGDDVQSAPRRAVANLTSALRARAGIS